MENEQDVSAGVAAIRTLMEVIRKSECKYSKCKQTEQKGVKDDFFLNMVIYCFLLVFYQVSVFSTFFNSTSLLSYLSELYREFERCKLYLSGSV